jgi:hypothetical protein
MTERGKSVIERAYGRAEADLQREGIDRQADVVRLIHQIGAVQHKAEDGAGAKYLIVHGAHNAGFRIAVVVTTDGQVGWSLV